VECQHPVATAPGSVLRGRVACDQIIAFLLWWPGNSNEGAFVVFRSSTAVFRAVRPQDLESRLSCRSKNALAAHHVQERCKSLSLERRQRPLHGSDGV